MKLLDLFSGAGGASRGYMDAGFHVTGVDHAPMPRYVGDEFIQADALQYVREHGHLYDVIHASPPCQAFTRYKNARPDLPRKHPNLISATRLALASSGAEWVMENVAGAPLYASLVLCGSMFGLDVRRHRLFESRTLIMSPGQCNHAAWEPNRYPGGRSRERGGPRVLCRGTVEVGRWNIPLEVQQEAMGIDWMSLDELSEAIPPAYTREIGTQLMWHLEGAA